MINTTPVFAIVDDQTLMREVASDFLRQNGYEVALEAVNGKDLLEKLRIVEQLPDACLLDLNMPEMDGFETARYLRQNFPSIRILAFSQFAQKAQVEEILECGADAFLPKESEPDRWRRELAGVIGKNQ